MVVAVVIIYVVELCRFWFQNNDQELDTYSY
jgi:hypothetical protein